MLNFNSAEELVNHYHEVGRRLKRPAAPMVPVKLPWIEPPMKTVVEIKMPRDRVRMIIRAACDFYNVSVEDVMSKSRKAHILKARFAAVFLLRDLTTMSFPAIAKALGGRDHTTMVHAFHKINMRILEDAKLADEIKIIRAVATS